jgi:hypothetical protein
MGFTSKHEAAYVTLRNTSPLEVFMELQLSLLLMEGAR